MGPSNATTDPEEPRPSEQAPKRRGPRALRAVAGTLALVAIVLAVAASAGIPQLGIMTETTAFAVLGLGVIGVVLAMFVLANKLDRHAAAVEAEADEPMVEELPMARVEELVDESEARMSERIEANRAWIGSLKERVDDLERPVVALRDEGLVQRVEGLERDVRQLDRGDRSPEAHDELRQHLQRLEAAMARQHERGADQHDRLIGEVREARGREDALLHVLERQESMLLSILHRQEARVEDIARAVRELPVEREDGNGHKRRAARRGREPRYPVAAYNIREVHGIGPREVRALRDHGVNLTDTLLHTDIDELADATGIARERLQRFSDMAELMSIDGIGPELSERLVDAGITSINGLAELSGEDLRETLLASYEDHGPDNKEIVSRSLTANAEALVRRARAASMRLDARA